MSATLYRIDKNDFQKIIDKPYDFGLFKITKGYEIFSQSFDGLQFVLSKGLDKINNELIEQIFYPKSFCGEQIDFSNLEIENLPADFDFERQPAFFNDPNTVSKIYDLLNSITIEKFNESFDHNELNKQDIYPGNIWNNKQEDDIAFNARHLVSEFENLKAIFKSAKENEDYLLSYVG
ncbi:MAG: DUF1877 family protein [Ferruginibacter sp.]